MPLLQTQGPASVRGYGENLKTGGPVYIEDVFSTWVYKGNNSTQTITNGINVSDKGGLVWIKDRTEPYNHKLIDTARGIGTSASGVLSSNLSAAAYSDVNSLTAFNSNGFSLGGNANYNSINDTYASWTFRKQPKFFDIVTFTAPAAGVTTVVSHSLGSVPGCIIMKSTTNVANWVVLHRYDQTMFGELNTTSAFQSAGFNANFTSTSFSVRGGFNINANGGTYVAYLFAHDAGGFGNAGADNVISCGSFTSTGSAFSVNLGYEPQWLLFKPSSGAGDWNLVDNMRGFQVDRSGATVGLQPNTAAAEAALGLVGPTSTGFTFDNGGSGVTFIYIAIRRGPMRTPTVGTSVYTSASRTGTASVMPRWVAGFPVDWAIRQSVVSAGGGDWQAGDRLRGAVQLKPNLTEVETAASLLYIFDSMAGYSTLGAAGSDSGDRSWMFRRAPGFFDVVCYTGTNANPQVVNHNLSVVPELVISKVRSNADGWIVGYNFGASTYNRITLNSTGAAISHNYGSGSMFGAIPTANTLSWDQQNTSPRTFVTYLFASCPGVSKVGSYTGNGSSQTINCGFTSGARFILIKRTDSTGDWYVWDSTRGIVAGNDPHLSLNTTAAEVTTDDSIDTDSTGFIINQLAATNINVTSATYIFLAIA
jgi:hypothetical protein